MGVPGKEQAFDEQTCSFVAGGEVVIVGSEDHFIAEIAEEGFLYFFIGFIFSLGKSLRSFWGQDTGHLWQRSGNRIFSTAVSRISR